MRSYRFLLVDDHTVVRQGIKQILAEEFHPAVFGEARQVPDALALLRERPWDIVILDITLPGRNGLELLRDIRQFRPNLPVLVLSMHSEEQYAVRAIKAGATGYMTKECAPSDLIAAVRVALQGRRWLSPTVAEQLALQTDETVALPPHKKLSDREYQILCLIASGKTAAEIAKTISLSVKSVYNYRSRILAKMQLRNSAELAHYATAHRLIP